MQRDRHVRPAIVLSLALVASPATATEVPSERTTWLALATPHFLVVSDAGRGKVHDVAVDLERLVTAIGRVAPLLAWSPLPTQAVMISSNERFEEYCAAASGQSCAGLAGLFMAGRHGNYLLVSAGHFDDARAIACHEMTHSIIRNTSPDIPLWLNEGMAEVYGSVAPVGDDILIGRPEAQHLAVLNERGLMPVAKLLSVSYDSPEYNAGNLRPVFYAESWLMTHYMLVGAPRNRARLTDFLARLRRGEEREQAFSAAFGVDTREFTKELHAYAQQHRMMALRLAGADLALPALPQARPLPRDEALSLLALPILDGSARRPGAADALLAAALRADPASPLANGLWALSLWKAGQADRAAALFEGAVRSPSSPTLPSVLYAELLLDRAARSADPAHADTARAKELLNAALASEPDNLSALIGLGTLCVISPAEDAAAGIRALERALVLAPSRVDAGGDLAQLLARTGKPALAVEVVRRHVLTSPDAATRAQAKELMADIHVETANLAASQQRFGDAATELEAALTACDAPEVQARVRARLKQVRDAGEYSAAVELANKGDATGAVAALDRLIPTVDDPNLRSSAETLRHSLAEHNAEPGQENPEGNRGWLLSERDLLERRQAAAQREASRYNEAVALANRGKVKEAIAIADDLATHATNETVKSAAAGLAHRLELRLAGARPSPTAR